MQKNIPHIPSLLPLLYTMRFMKSSRQTNFHSFLQYLFKLNMILQNFMTILILSDNSSDDFVAIDHLSFSNFLPAPFALRRSARLSSSPLSAYDKKEAILQSLPFSYVPIYFSVMIFLRSAMTLFISPPSSSIFVTFSHELMIVEWSRLKASPMRGRDKLVISRVR